MHLCSGASGEGCRKDTQCVAHTAASIQICVNPHPCIPLKVDSCRWAAKRLGPDHPTSNSLRPACLDLTCQLQLRARKLLYWRIRRWPIHLQDLQCECSCRRSWSSAAIPDCIRGFALPSSGQERRTEQAEAVCL